MRNVLSTSIEPFAWAPRCVCCAQVVETESDVSFDGSRQFLHPVTGKSRRCEGCEEFIHEGCSKHGLCNGCASCAECDGDTGEHPITVCKGTIYPPEFKVGRESRFERVCKRCYVERVGEKLARDPFKEESERHREVTLAHETLAIALAQIMPGLSPVERATFTNVLRETTAA